MAQIDDLMTALGAANTNLSTLAGKATEVVTILKEIEAQQGGGGPDLTAAIAAAQSLATGIETASASISPVIGPSVTQVTPTTGPAAGGTGVSILGTGFTGATAVNFGTVPGTGLVVDSDTQITVQSPPGTGAADVTVVTPNGTSTVVAADKFTYGP